MDDTDYHCDLARIAYMDPLRQTQYFLDAITLALYQAPGVRTARLYITRELRRYKIRKLTKNKLERVADIISLRNSLPYDPISFCLARTYQDAFVIWNTDESNPILPGGFSAITPQSPTVKSGILKCNFNCRVILPLVGWNGYETKRVLAEGSSAGIPTTVNSLSEMNSIAVLNLTDENAVVPFCEWLVEYGFSLAKIIGERMFRLTQHPYVDFWYDPEMLFDFTEREEEYLQTLVEQGDLPVNQLAKIMGLDSRTVNATRRGLTEKYDGHHIRLACRAGYASKE